MWLHAIIHWFDVQYWSMSWPNIFAPSVWTLFGILIADFRAKRRHDKLLMPKPETVSSIASQLEELSDKLVELLGGKTNDDHE